MTMTNNNILIHKNKSFAQERISEILDFANRQFTEKKKDFHRLNEEQEGWVKRKMAAPAWTWEMWDGLIEEWTPWSSFGEPINVWRYYKAT